MKTDFVEVYLTDGAEVGVDSGQLARALACFSGERNLKVRRRGDSEVVSRNGHSLIRVTLLNHSQSPGVAYRVSGDTKYVNSKSIEDAIQLVYDVRDANTGKLQPVD